MRNSPVIALEALSVVADGRTILAPLTLQVTVGEKVVINGPSGSGKTTLLKCLLGLAHASAGRIALFDETLQRDSVWSLRQRLAYAAQEPAFATGTVREALARPFAFKANEARQSQLTQLPDWLERVDLSPDLLDSAVASLSGGEKQRLALVMALMLDRPVILADEITAGLDDARQQAVVELIRASQKTWLIVSHTPEVFSFADQRITLLPNAQGSQ